MGKHENQQKTDAARKRESERIINRIANESEQVGTSSMARTANKVRDHFLGEEMPEADPVEIWGKRIARGLAVVAFVALVISIYTNYIAPQ